LLKNGEKPALQERIAGGQATKAHRGRASQSWKTTIPCEKRSAKRSRTGMCDIPISAVKTGLLLGKRWTQRPGPSKANLRKSYGHRGGGGGGGKEKKTRGSHHCQTLWGGGGGRGGQSQEHLYRLDKRNFSYGGRGEKRTWLHGKIHRQASNDA